MALVLSSVLYIEINTSNLLTQAGHKQYNGRNITKQIKRQKKSGFHLTEISLYTIQL